MRNCHIFKQPANEKHAIMLVFKRFRLSVLSTDVTTPKIWAARQKSDFYSNLYVPLSENV